MSGSLSSLRRRWAQSCSASLDSKTNDNLMDVVSNNVQCKKRAKLGMALLIGISNCKNE